MKLIKSDKKKTKKTCITVNPHYPTFWSVQSGKSSLKSWPDVKLIPQTNNASQEWHVKPHVYVLMILEKTSYM